MMSTRKTVLALALGTIAAASAAAQLHPYHPPEPLPERPRRSPTPAALAPAPGVTRTTIASVASYGTGFEPVEGFAPGWIDGQVGWSTFLSSMTEAHVDISTPASGVQHLQIAKEPLLPGGYAVGAFSPPLGPQPVEPTTVSVEVNITAISNGADYFVTPQGPSYGLKTAEVLFDFTGDIRVLDQVGGVWFHYDTFVDWTPNVYGTLEIRIDPGADSIEYYYNGALIYTSVAGVWGAPVVEEVVLFSDNWNLGEVGNFDNLLISPPGANELTLETTDTCAQAGPIEITLWARDLTQLVTGYQAFLTYDDTILSFDANASYYIDDVFSQHITAMGDALLAPGALMLDGSVPYDPPAPGTDQDTPLAVLVFQPLTNCDTTTVDFDDSGYFQSELSYQGLPLITTTIETPTITIDQVPPVVTCAPDIEVNADAGLCTALVNVAPPTAYDDCTAVDSTIYYQRSDDPQALLSDPFPSGTTTITWYVYDTCGNEATCEQDVTVNAANEVVLDVVLAGVTTPTTRCLRLQTNDCGVFSDVSVDFVDHDTNPATPVRAQAVGTIPCGTWTSLCVKDEQHTLWSDVTISIVGTQYVLDAPVTLTAGDTDNDSDIDINDVTWLLFQFGDSAEAGGCPWDGTRDADFSNNGVVGAEDYLFISGNWLASTTCPCTLAGPGGGEAPARQAGAVLLAAELPPAVAAAADLNADGVIDYADVELFERRQGLSGALSTRMKQTTHGHDATHRVKEKGGARQ